MRHPPTVCVRVVFANALRCIASLTLLSLTAGCPGSGGAAVSSKTETITREPDPSSIVAQLPENVRGKLSEELGSMPLHRVADESCGISLSVEAPAAPKIEVMDDDDSIHFLVIEIPEAIIECFLYGELLDTASTLENFFVLTAGETSDWYGIDETGVSVVEGRPYLYATAITKQRSDEINLWGNFHVAVGAAQYETLACIASGPGRRQTFRRIFERMLQTVETPATKTPGGRIYHSISQMTSPGGGAAAYTEMHVYEEEDGQTIMEHYHSRILRAADLHLVGQDQYDLVHSRSGTIVAGEYSVATRGTLDLNVKLATREGSSTTYEVTGTVMDKDFESTIETQSGISDVKRNTAEVGAFVKATSARVIGLKTYDPSIDPSKLLTMLIERRGRTERGIDAVISIGGTQFEAEIDEEGDMVTMVMEIGGARLDVERVWLEGSLLD